MIIFITDYLFLSLKDYLKGNKLQITKSNCTIL